MNRPLRYMSIAVILGVFSALAIGATNSQQPDSMIAKGLGGSLIISTTWDPSTGGGIGIDELYNGVSPYGTNIYEPLVFVDDDMNLQPGLAKSWERINDKTWRFHLRDNVLFHDGTSFDAEAVKSRFDYILSHSPYSESAKSSLFLENVTVVDAHTVEMTTFIPLGCLPGRLSNPGTVIVSPKMREFGMPDGTGPFKFVDIVPLQTLKLVKNDLYWGDKAKVDELTIKTISDPGTKIMALESGDVDLIYGVPVSEVLALGASSDIQVFEKLIPMTTAIHINSMNGSLSNLMVRKALSHAIDKNAIVDTIYEGIGEPAKSIISPAVSWSADGQLVGYSYDPARSRQLLSEAGWKDTNGDGYLEKGDKILEMELTYVPSGGLGFTSQYGPVAEAIQDQLKRIGVKLIMKPIEYGMYWSILMSGQYDLLLDYYSAWDGDASALITNRYYSSGYYSNSFNLTVAERSQLNRLIEEALATSDSNLMENNYRAVQKIVIDDLALDIPLVYEYSVVAANKKVKGFEIHPLTAWGVTMNRVYIEGE